MDRGSRVFTVGTIGRKALVAALLATTALPASIALIEGKALAQAAAQTSFDIPAGTLASVLASFGSQSGTQVSYDASLAAGKTSPGIRGAATREQALAQILQGTGLGYSFSDAASVVITDRVSAAHTPVDADGALVLDTISVTGDRERNAATGSGFQGTPDWVYETAASVGVVSGEAIRNSGARSIRDSIASAPGVYSGEGQGSFPTVSPNIRGVGDSGRVVVSIDGARQNAQDGGRYGGGMGGYGTAFVDPGFIRQADINKNPDASAGNAGSLGGGVDFRTVNADDIIEPGRDWGIEFNGTAGTNAHDYSGSVIVASRIGDYLSLTAGLSKAKLGDYEGGKNGVVTGSNIYDLTGRESWSSLVKLEGDFGDVRTSLSWLHQENDFAYSPTGGSLGSTFEAINDSVSGNLAWNPDNPLIDARMTFWLNSSSQSELRQARLTWNGGIMDPETSQERELLSFGGSLQNTSEVDTTAGLLTFNYGVEAFRDDASSHVMNDDIASNPAIASGWLPYNRPGQRDMASAFLSGKWEPAEWVTLSGGVRYDWTRLHGTSKLYTRHIEPGIPSRRALPVMLQRDYLEANDPGSALLQLCDVQGLPFACTILNRMGEVHGGTFYIADQWIPGTPDITTYPSSELDIDRSYGQLLPSATVEFKPAEWIRPYVSYSHSFRPPTINESFFSGSIIPANGISTTGAPNLALRPETARTWELGVNILRDGVFTGNDAFRFKASAFHRTIRDYIVLGQIKAATPQAQFLDSFVNTVGDTTMYGLELEGNYDAGSFWVGGAATWLETRWPHSTEIFYHDGVPSSGAIHAFAGAVPPRFKVSVDAGVRLFDRNVTLGARVNHVTPNLARYLDQNGDLTETGDPYTTVDLHTSFRLGSDATLNLAVNNATDRRYIPATGNYIAPGRTFLASVKARF